MLAPPPIHSAGQHHQPCQKSGDRVSRHLFSLRAVQVTLPSPGSNLCVQHSCHEISVAPATRALARPRQQAGSCRGAKITVRAMQHQEPTCDVVTSHLQMNTARNCAQLIMDVKEGLNLRPDVLIPAGSHSDGRLPPAAAWLQAHRARLAVLPPALGSKQAAPVMPPAQPRSGTWLSAWLPLLSSAQSMQAQAKSSCQLSEALNAPKHHAGYPC